MANFLLLPCRSQEELRVEKQVSIVSSLRQSQTWRHQGGTCPSGKGSTERSVPLALFFFFFSRSIHLKCYSSYKCWGLMCEAFVQDENCRLRCYAGIFSYSEDLNGGGEPTVAGCFSTAVISPWKRCCYIPYIIFKIHALHTKIRTTSNSKTAN